MERDASIPIDANTMLDSSTSIDANTTLDSSTPLDANATFDSSAPPDAAPTLDASTPIDSGTSLDAAVAMDAGGPMCALPLVCPSSSPIDVAWLRAPRSGRGRPGAVALDAEGGVVVAGVYRSALDVDGETLPLSGAADFYVVRYRADGTVAWRVRGATTNDDLSLVAAAFGPDGRVYLAGAGAGALDFGGGVVPEPPAPGLRPAFVVALASDGAFLWAARFPELGAESFALDPAGTPILLGKFTTSVTIPGVGALSGLGSGADLALVSLDPATGAARSALVVGEPARNEFSGVVAAGPDGDLYAAGAFIEAGGAGDRGLWLQRMSPEGTVRWRRREAALPDYPTSQVIDLAVTSTGDAILLADAWVDLGTGPLTPFWVARFRAADGATAWATRDVAGQRLTLSADRIAVANTWSVSPLVSLTPCAFTASGSGLALLELDLEGRLRAFGAIPLSAAPTAIALRASRLALAGTANAALTLPCADSPVSADSPFVATFTLPGG